MSKMFPVVLFSVLITGIHTCPYDKFHCMAGTIQELAFNQCIPSEWICDGEWDCIDGADERGQDCNITMEDISTPFTNTVGMPCDESYCLNGGLCVMENFTRHCSCPIKFDGDSCEHLKPLHISNSYAWIIAFNLIVVIIIFLIFAIFVFYMNRNLRELAVRFKKESNKQNEKCEIDV